MIRMPTRLVLLLAAALVTAGCAAGRPSTHGHPTEVSADIGFYFDDLAPYGTWVEVSTYGWVWCPLDTPVGWRPYTVGYWVYSDEGWLWVSEDPWGWIPYHYGRWTWSRDYGWFWVPGDVWAPAWVAWRYGPDWVGWAPLPPDVYWRPGVGLMYTDPDLDRHIHRYRWSFTPSTEFGTARERVRVEPQSRNVTLLGKTRNVTKYVAGPRPVEEGMRPDLIRERSGKPIERYQVVDSKTPIRERGVTIRERSVEVYRPESGVTATVRERVRDVPPAERPVPPRQAVERLQKEQKQIDDVVKRQRQELTNEHARELQERPPGASALEIMQRQLEELRAQREVEERQRQEVEARERQVVKQQEKATRESNRDAQERQRETKEPQGDTKGTQGETKTRTR